MRMSSKLPYCSLTRKRAWVVVAHDEFKLFGLVEFLRSAENPLDVMLPRMDGLDLSC